MSMKVELPFPALLVKITRMSAVPGLHLIFTLKCSKITLVY